MSYGYVYEESFVFPKIGMIDDLLEHETAKSLSNGIDTILTWLPLYDVPPSRPCVLARGSILCNLC